MTADIIHLVQLHDNAAWTNSLLVATRFGKRHKHVLDAIRDIECSEHFHRTNFRPVEFTDNKGEVRPMYELTRDGAMFLIMGFTGCEAAKWKEHFIEAFNEAEKRLLQTAPAATMLAQKFITLHPHWAEVRELTIQGKTIDQIADLVTMSRSAIGRARMRMHDLGLLDDAPLYQKRELGFLLSSRHIDYTLSSRRAS